MGLFISYSGYLFLQHAGILKSLSEFYVFVCLVAQSFPNGG